MVNFRFNKKNVVYCILILSIVFSLFVFPNLVYASSNAVTYRVYNPETGLRYSNRDYTLYRTSAQSRTIFGTDDRNIDYSKKGVIKIIGTDNYLGTGFVVGNHVIATAAHCVTTDDAKANVIEDIILLQEDEDECIFLSHATPVEIHIPDEFMDYLENSTSYFHTQNPRHHWSYDYALITVEEDLSEYRQFSLATTLDYFYPDVNDDNLTDNAVVNVTGYPQYYNGIEVNTKTIHRMYTGSGVVLSNSNLVNWENPYKDLMFYNTDVSSGNSGGPVYCIESYGGNTYYEVIGICTAQLSYANVGVRINENMLRFYLSNPYITY